jgi:iron complex outermembrane receptor protein
MNMGKSHLCAATALSTALLLGLTTPAWAQQSRTPPPSSDKDNEEIIVTARRTQERLQDVPISITVLNQEEIAKRNIYNAGDLGSYVPSLSTNANFGPQKSSFAIRGFIQEGRTSPSVGVYFADVVAPRANTGTTSGNGAGIGSFFDLQNVQVLKGPQGTLFGRNTTGGAILLVPTKPTSKLEGYLEGSLGNYNMKRLQGVLNVPLNSMFRARLAMDWQKADGYLRNRSGIGPKQLGDTNYIAARLSIVGDLTPDLENYTIFSYSRSNTKGVIPKIVACHPTSEFPVGEYPYGPLAAALAPLGCLQIARAQARGDGFWDVDNANPHPKELQTSWQVINTTSWTASDSLTVKNIISYAQFREDASFNLFGDNFLIPFAGGLRFPVITIETGASGSYADQSTFTEELQLIGHTAGDRLKWQAGAYLEISKPLKFNSAFNHNFLDCTDAAAYLCTNLPGFGTISSANIKNSFNNKGIYAQATYKLTDRLSLTGGIRYTMDRMTDESRNINIVIPTPGTALFFCQNVAIFNGGSIDIPIAASGPNGPECDNVIKIKSNRPTWLIDLDYKPSDNVLLYAKWARGYRQGTIISSNIGLETTGPEKVDTYEVGAKTSFHGSVSGYFNVAAFYNDFRDQQLAVNTVVAPAFNGRIPPAQAIVNAGKSRIWGIEVDASVRLFEGLKIDAGYTYLNTKLLKFTPPAPVIFYSELEPVAAEGHPLAQSPKNRFFVTATYMLPLAEGIGRISIGGTFTHTDANAVHEARFAPVTHRVTASNLLNLNADWDSIFGTPIDLAFFMTNVTNEKRIAYPIATTPTMGSETGHLNLPRMWGFRAKYRFGE